VPARQAASPERARRRRCPGRFGALTISLAPPSRWPCAVKLVGELPVNRLTGRFILTKGSAGTEGVSAVNSFACLSHSHALLSYERSIVCFLPAVSLEYADDFFAP
jgi:hypothetical protein